MRRVLVLFAFLFLAGPVTAQGDPESAYRAFHQSILGPLNEQLWVSQLPAARRAAFEKDPQASVKWVVAIRFMTDEMPRSYRITGKVPGPGKSMRLSATGQGKDFFGKPEEQSGVIDLVEEGGVWKINEVTWGKRKI
jgi:hypothetical protein